METARGRLVQVTLAGACSLGLVVASASMALSALSVGPVRTSAAATSGSRSVALRPLTTPPAQRASRGGMRSALVPVGPSFTGAASWYGGSFQGRRTANGELFDTRALTAASRTLPFGTRLRVCRSERCVVVRINDRGPYVGQRVLDLSYAAAQLLGYDGVVQVTATPVALTMDQPAQTLPARRTVPAGPA